MSYWMFLLFWMMAACSGAIIYSCYATIRDRRNKSKELDKPLLDFNLIPSDQIRQDMVKLHCEMHDGEFIMLHNGQNLAINNAGQFVLTSSYHAIDDDKFPALALFKTEENPIFAYKVQSNIGLYANRWVSIAQCNILEVNVN